MARSSTTKDSIRSSALGAFNEFGFEATPIELICQRSGASVGSLYHHFGNKEGIAVALHEQALEALEAAIKARLARADAAPAILAAFPLGYADAATAAPELMRFLMQSRGYMVRTSAHAALESARREREQALLRHWLQPLVETGVLQPVPWDCVAPLVLGPVREYVWQWLAGRSSIPVADRAADLAQAAWRSMARPPGG